MKKVILCIKSTTQEQAYVGGVVTIINDYMANSQYFINKEYSLELFDYQMKTCETSRLSKLDNIRYAVRQKRELCKYISHDSNTLVNIHTSREFLFLKDVLLCKAVVREHKIPTVLTVHVGEIGTVFNRILPFKRMCIRYINKYINRIVFLSDNIRNQFVDAGVDPQRCEVLYNFHNIPHISNAEDLPKNAKLNLLFVGAIHREKGILELLTALKKIDKLDYHIDICGKLTDSSIKSNFESLVEASDGKISTCGYVSGIEKSKLYKRADVLILPSYHEGMPLVILESLAAGCAIISTKVGATPEILDYNNAIWVDVGSSDQIAEAIKKLYTSPEKLLTMKEANKQKSMLYTIEDNVNCLCEIYNKTFSDR